MDSAEVAHDPVEPLWAPNAENILLPKQPTHGALTSVAGTMVWLLVRLDAVTKPDS